MLSQAAQKLVAGRSLLITGIVKLHAINLNFCDACNNDENDVGVCNNKLTELQRLEKELVTKELATKELIPKNRVRVRFRFT